MLKHITYICPETKKETQVKFSQVTFRTVVLYSDWTENKLDVYRCPLCGKKHTFEI